MPLDLRESPALARELPGLATAFDAQQMWPLLQDALLGGGRRYRIDACRPRQAAYLLEGGCLLRYELEVTDATGRRSLRPLVTARLFRTFAGCRRYAGARLAPLAERARGRDELEPFVKPAAVLTSLNAAVGVFPIDGELPTLVDATDQARIGEILERAGLVVTGVRVHRGHYGRRNRCVLRYELEGEERRRVVYGKVTAPGRGATAAAALRALRESKEIAARGIRIPGLLGFDPDLQLLLVEELPGAPSISRLLAAEAPPHARLEAAIEESARAAATLHASGIRLGRRRRAADDLAALDLELRASRRFSPPLGELLRDRLRRAAAALDGSDPLRAAFCHGDFSHTQVVFDGDRCGLVDFDTVGHAEPPLDLGHFLAYLRLAIVKAHGSSSDELPARFVDAYVAAADGLRHEARLRARVPAYEVISLVRLALHSWRKFKPSRLAYVLELLEERTSCLPS